MKPVLHFCVLRPSILGTGHLATSMHESRAQPQSTKPNSSSMTPTKPFPEGSSPSSTGGQVFCVFRRFSDCRIAAGKSLREISHCPATACPKIVLEMPMDHVALYRQFLCQLFLVIVQQFRVGHDDYGDRNSQGVENGAGSCPTRKLRASVVGKI